MTRYVRLTITALALILFTAAALVAIPHTTAEAQAQNLLTNPGFDGPYTAFIPQTDEQKLSCPAGICGTAQIPAGWWPYWTAQRPENLWWENKMPEFKAVCNASPCPFMNRVKGGEQAAQYFNFEGSNTAGYWQRVTVPANATLTFSVWGQAWSSDGDDPVSTSPTAVNMRVGIDPTGGANPYAPQVVWSATQNPYDAYVLFQVTAAAQGDQVTVFMWSQTFEMRKHNDFYWDEASLVVGGVAPAASGGGTTGGASAPSAQAFVPGPTPTPNADGLILVTVQAGDSMWALAARAGLTLDEFLALNPGLTQDSFIQTGEQYIIGRVEPPAAEPTAEPTPEPTAEIAADGAEPEPAVTEAEPTAEPTPEPTAAPVGATVCLRAFEDTNRDGAFATGEPSKAAVAFTIANGEAVVSNYVTDGVAEPYCIEGLPAGNYRISRSLATNEVASNTADWALALTDGARFDLDFGSYTAEATTQAPLETAMTDNTVAAPTPAENATPTADVGIGGWFVWVIVGIAAMLLVGVILVVLSGRRA